MNQDLITSKHRVVPVLLSSQFALLTDQTRSVQDRGVQMVPRKWAEFGQCLIFTFAQSVDRKALWTPPMK